MSEAVEFKKLNWQSFFYSISQIGVTNFLESYFPGYFFKILAKHNIAFFLTFNDTLFVSASYIMESATEETKDSGTIVAIMENANSWAG